MVRSGRAGARSDRASGLKENAVQINIANDLPTISVDARLIQQALGALLSNAVVHGSERSADRSERGAR